LSTAGGGGGGAGGGRVLRVLIVDDSHFMRGAIGRALESGGLVVAGAAGDGLQAVAEAARLRPDVITMDVNMPRLDGVSAVRRIMAECPTPIVMLSAYTKEGAQATMEALAAGAVDFLAKPSGEVSADLATVVPVLLEKVRAAAESRPSAGPAAGEIAGSIRGRKQSVRPEDLRAGKAAPRRMSTLQMAGQDTRVVCIGVSTGGPAALARVIPRLPADLRAVILIVQHMPPQFTAALAERLGAESELLVREAVTGERLTPGKVIIAPGDKHMVIGSSRNVVLTDEPEENGCRPSADVTMRSVAAIYGAQVLGVILTGMGRDGASGMAAVKAAGGATIAQDEGTSVIFGMPRAAIELGVVDKVLPLDVIAEEIAEWG
jgi:two-component system chemotaxis response regulator CheB